MLENVDLDSKISKSDYKQSQAMLDERLPELQRAVRKAGVPTVIVLEGWDAAGKGDVLSALLYPLDPRGFRVFAIDAPTSEERARPPLWRFAMMLPQYGNMSIYDHSWYRHVLNERIEGNGNFRGAYERLRAFERHFIEDGGVLLKFFLHISKKEQAQRFKDLQKDPAFAWQIGQEEKKRHDLYKQYYSATEDMLRETSTPFAPWKVIPPTDIRYASNEIGRTLLHAWEAVVAGTWPKPELRALPLTSGNPLDHVNLDHSTSRDEYEKEVRKLQEELRRLQHLVHEKRLSVAIVYEGWDAAGKGGSIRRLTRRMDARGYRVVPVAAPEGDEKKHHYLWRFWRHVPARGTIVIFDRSWYGRVLVERVEGFARVDEWQRAYQEINEFEQQLCDAGTIVIKFWVHISNEEQLKRFKAREEDPAKSWKITGEDWRNREKWGDYWSAVGEMIDRTSTDSAPWTIIEGNDKRYARLKAMRVVVQRLQKALSHKA